MKSFWQMCCPSLESKMLSPDAKSFTETEQNEIMSYLPDFKGKKVLELGAGIGHFTGRLAQMADHVTAVDSVQAFIDENKKLNGKKTNINFNCTDITQLVYSPNPFDLVFSNWLFMYMTVEEISEVFEKVLKWLSPGGCFFFRESCNHESEQQGGMMVLKEADAQTKEYLQGLQTKVEELEENQRSLLETQRIIAETQLRQEEILNSVEQHLQKDPVVDLINILEKNACQDGSHNCSINAKCIDQFMSYECQCLPGFKGDGYVCDDINECYDQPCHHNATCSNTDGSYTCSCDKPYQGDGITCETICQSPSIEVIGLGCITAILEWGPWETQKERCEDMGMQLVEDFKKEHITIFSKAFGSQMHDDKQPWVGARKGKWAISGKPVPHDMWLSGEPDRGIEDCVYMRLRKNEANGLGDSSKCLNNGRALCQLLY